MKNRKTDESLNSVTLICPIRYGVGRITIPQSLKSEIFQTFAIGHSIHSLNNFNTVYYLTSNASYHREKDHVHKSNIIQTFMAKNEVTYFSSKIICTLNQAPDTLEVFCNTLNDRGQLTTDQSYQGNLCIELYGFRA